jgi:hypothetical protein
MQQLQLKATKALITVQHRSDDLVGISRGQKVQLHWTHPYRGTEALGYDNGSIRVHQAEGQVGAPEPGHMLIIVDSVSFVTRPGPPATCPISPPDPERALSGVAPSRAAVPPSANPGYKATIRDYFVDARRGTGRFPSEATIAMHAGMHRCNRLCAPIQTDPVLGSQGVALGLPWLVRPPRSPGQPTPGGFGGSRYSGLPR